MTNLKILILAAVIVLQPVSAQTTSEFKWEAHDVSIGYPLPENTTSEGLLKMQTNGVTLLPREAFEMLGSRATGLPHFAEMSGREKVYDFLRVVSVRIDPCFDVLDASKEKKCVRMIRLTAQALSPMNDDGSWDSLSDASIHLFYQLTDVEFVDFLNELRALNQKHPYKSDVLLGLHPVLKKDGLLGDFGLRLNELLLKYADLKHLVRFTFMTTGRNSTWNWGRIDKVGETFVHIKQKLLQEDGTAMEFNTDGFTQEGIQQIDGDLFVPFLPKTFRTTENIDKLKNARGQINTSKLKAAVTIVAENENPQRNTTSSINCSACHTSNVTLRYALNRLKLSEVPKDITTWYSEPLAQPLTAKVPSRVERQNMHAFSYFYENFTVAPRAVNETLETVKYLNSPEFVSGLTEEARRKLDLR